MIKSMTGYGSAEHIGCDRKFTVEIRSVNHRYSDVNVRTPRSFAFAEDTIRKTVGKHLSRGKIDVFLSVEGLHGETGEVSLNAEIARGYYSALSELREMMGFQEPISLRDISAFSDVFSLQRAEADTEAMESIIRETTKEALDAFTAMRGKEGEQLYRDLSENTNQIEVLLGEIEKRAPQIVSEYSTKLEDRIREILANIPVDEGRLLNEVAFFADKVNVNEEIIRLHSHILQMRAFLDATEPVGRKMDFLIQEMNREVNTIGSKTSDLAVAKLVIDMKAEIEKLREQVQNVE